MVYGVCVHVSLCRYDKPRAATVIAKTEGTLWTIDRRLFRSILMKNDLVRKNTIRMFRRISVLRAVPLEKLQKLSDLLTEVSFDFLHYIYRRDDVIDSFYFLLRGECEVTSSPADGEEGDEMLIKRIMEREYFGERILLDPGEHRSRFNVLVSSQTAKLLKLSKEQFESVLGPLSELIANYQARVAKAAAPPTASFNDSNELSNFPSKFGNIKLNSVVSSDVIGTLVLGTFGSMTPNCTVRTYLLTDVDEQCCSNTVLNCIDACKMVAFSDHACPSLPRMVCLYRQLNAIHLLFNKPIVCDLKTMIDHLATDSTTNGASGVVQHHKQKLSIDVIQYIMACVVNGLEALHAMGVVYRNVNPGGLHVDGIGRVTFVDFCSSKISPKGRKTYTLCGVPDFLSPEQISQSGHTTSVDLWSCGVLLYELITGGSNPFHCSSEIKTYEKISSLGSKSFPKVSMDPASSGVTMKSPVNALIQELINPNPEARIGSSDMKALKNHEYFKGVDWNSLGTKQDSPFALQAIHEQTELLKLAEELMDSDECPEGGIHTIPSEIIDSWNVSYVGFGWDSEIDVSSNV